MVEMSLILTLEANVPLPTDRLATEHYILRDNDLARKRNDGVIRGPDLGAPDSKDSS